MPGSSDQPSDAQSRFEEAARAQAQARYVLRLYITGLTPRSLAAIENVKRTCEEHLAGRYELEILDVAAHPELAKDAQIIAAPTLIKELPLPLRRLIGNMADEQKVLVGLDLRPRK